MSPLAKLLLAAGTALGIGYLIFRKPKPKPKPRPEGVPPGVVIPIPTPEGVPPPSPPVPPTPMPPTVPGAPGGLAPGPGAAPPGWRKTFNDGVMITITEGRGREDIRTADELQRFVASGLFSRATWPPPDIAPPWQKTVWRETRAVLSQLANAQSWPFAGVPETVDAAITFWVSAEKAREYCRSQVSLPEAITLCTANRVFPDVIWPPPSGAIAWQREAWRRFGMLT